MKKIVIIATLIFISIVAFIGGLFVLYVKIYYPSSPYKFEENQLGNEDYITSINDLQNFKLVGKQSFRDAVNNTSGIVFKNSSRLLFISTEFSYKIYFDKNTFSAIKQDCQFQRNNPLEVSWGEGQCGDFYYFNYTKNSKTIAFILEDGSKEEMYEIIEDYLDTTDVNN